MLQPVAKKPIDDNKLTMLTTKQSSETAYDWYQAQTIKVFSVEEVTTIISSLDRGRLQEFVQLRTTAMDEDPELHAICSTRIDRVISPHWKVEENTTGPYDPIAAQLCFDVLKSLPNFYQILQNISDGIILGVSPNEMTWGWIAKDNAFEVTNIEYVNARRFIYDPTNKWVLNLYDYGSKAGKNGYGESLFPDKWLVHQSTECVGDPCLNGVMRTLARYYIYRAWIQKFWLHYDECFGQPFIDVSVDENTSESEMNKTQAAMERFSYDHTIVAKGATKINVTSPSSTASVDGFERHWNMTTAVCNRYVLGSSDLNQSGVVGAKASVETREGAVADPKRDRDMLGIAATIQEQLFKPVLRFNSHLFGGTMPGIPVFKLIYESDKTKDVTSQVPPQVPQGQIQVPAQLQPRVPAPSAPNQAQFTRDDRQAVFLAGDQGVGNALQIKATEAVEAFKRTGTYNEQLFGALLDDLRKQGKSAEEISKIKTELQRITLDAIENGKTPAMVARAILENSLISNAGVGESSVPYLEMAAKANTDLAYSGAKWEQAVQLKEETGKILYWQAHTMADGNVRPEHSVEGWDGAVFIVGNPETDMLLTPNRFGCRCYATYSTTIPEGAMVYESMPEKFRNVHDPNFTW